MIINFRTFVEAFQRLWRNSFETNLGLAIIALLLLIAGGTFGYSWLEGWSLFDSLYATIITITTVGYGDFSPVTPAGRTFAIFFTLIAIGLAGYGISTTAAVVIEHNLTLKLRKMKERNMSRIAQLEDHTIVCGATVIGHRVMNELNRRNDSFIIIEEDEETLKWALLWMHQDYVSKRRRMWDHLDELDYGMHEEKSAAELADEIGVPYLLEDPTDEQYLRRAGINRARGLIAALKDDRDNIAVVLSARHMANQLGNDNLRIVARVFEEMNMRRLYLAGANKVVSPNFVGGFQMATHMLTPVVGEFWDEMLYRDDQLMRFIDMPLSNEPKWVGQTVEDLRQKQGRIVVAIKRKDQYMSAPAPGEIFEADDILIVIGSA
ncbi:MAG: NAD-binding protein [Chloroflexota bacterium]